jgi:hypothetical protein
MAMRDLEDESIIAILHQGCGKSYIMFQGCGQQSSAAISSLLSVHISCLFLFATVCTQAQKGLLFDI